MPASIKPLVPLDSAYTTADLLYFTPPANGEVPFDRLYDHPTLPKTNVTYSKRNTKLYDLRPLLEQGREEELDVDVNGFQLVGGKVGKTEMKYEEWSDDSIIRDKYYKETEALVKKVTGATRVIIFDHTIRKQDKPGSPTPDTPDSRKPVARVHIDQTPAAGLKRVHRHAGAEADELLKGHASLINIWRPLLSPVHDAPLAIADARTINNERDLVPSRLLYEPPAAEGETYEVGWNEKHAWYYVSAMGKDEVLLLKCWDKENGAKTPHSGVKDDKYLGVEVEHPRESIEIRALVFREQGVEK